jgi:hypothetical protein
MGSSLSSSAATAKAAGGISKHVIMVLVMLMIGVLVFWGTSLEMVWSLINTLQMVCYLPLMIENYPEHVKVMFNVLEFSNMEIEILSDLFKKAIAIEGLEISPYNDRFFENGIESPLFLDNWASLLFSFLLSVITLLVWFALYSCIRIEKVKIKLENIISSYFFNNFLRFFTEGYLEIFFGVLLNVIAFPSSSTPEIISSILSVAVWGLCILYPFMAFALLFDKHVQIKANNPIYLKRYGTIYRDFKKHKEWYCLQFYPIFIMRRMIFVVFLIVLLEYPEVQWNAFIFFSWMVRINADI